LDHVHCLYGLQKLNFAFQLKGGTSLSKGFQAIDRFSEDIDIRVEPPPNRDVKTARNQIKPAQVQSRKDFYDWLATAISIDGIDKVERDLAFDNKDFFSAGIRLFYESTTERLEGLREGVLLEVGFDDVTPNIARDISSWAYNHATGRADIIDNQAKSVACYDLRYTFVEKLQTVSTKFRRQQDSRDSPVAFMRHYHDTYSLLQRPDVRAFIGTDEYKAHKAKRFPRTDNQNIPQNEDFVLSDAETRKTYEAAFAASGALYYGDKPTFQQVFAEIKKWIDRL
jgi:Nucleotidyl transferase AbiEii toxin, Type IV TA system